MDFIVEGCYSESLHASSLLLRLLYWGVSVCGVPLRRVSRYTGTDVTSKNPKRQIHQLPNYLPPM
jgi:hypothetical protein